jgi:16S rRNA processing protein RimM
VRGEVKIDPWADSPEFLRRFKTIYIDGRAVAVTSARVHGGFVIAKLEGVDDINAAMVLKNKIVSIDRADARLPKGSFFIADIIGAAVVDEKGNRLGELADVMEMPAQNIYVVKGEREILIPAVPEFVLSTDVEAGVITVRLIEGM